MTTVKISAGAAVFAFLLILVGQFVAARVPAGPVVLSINGLGGAEINPVYPGDPLLASNGR